MSVQSVPGANGGGATGGGGGEGGGGVGGGGRGGGGCGDGDIGGGSEGESYGWHAQMRRRLVSGSFVLHGATCVVLYQHWSTGNAATRGGSHVELFKTKLEHLMPTAVMASWTAEVEVRVARVAASHVVPAAWQTSSQLAGHDDCSR